VAVSVNAASARGESATADGSTPDVVERVWLEQGPRLWRSLSAFTGDPDLASEVVAESFAQLLGRGTDVRHADRWIWRAAFLIARGELRRRSRARAQTLEAVSSVSMPEPVVDVVLALRRLTPKQRLAAVLMLYADMPARDAARVMGCSPATARVHLSQARKRLRPLLEDLDG
jgi:RNA polymerase sigma-70 factor, ECF subfamily